MIAFDTDILTDILVGAPEFVTRASSIPRHEQAVPVVVIEEIIRGRLQVIRQAEAGTARVDLARAYALFEQTIRDVQRPLSWRIRPGQTCSIASGASSACGFLPMIYGLRLFV